jgi:hypothetical protein
MLHVEWIVTLTSISSPPLCPFYLKDDAGIGPVKMPIKSAMTADAVYHLLDYVHRLGEVTIWGR